MLLSFMKAARTSQAARRNDRIPSILDDATLADIGLDRRTLRAFCGNGCKGVTVQPSRALNPMTAMKSYGLTAEFG